MDHRTHATFFRAILDTFYAYADSPRAARQVAAGWLLHLVLSRAWAADPRDLDALLRELCARCAAQRGRWECRRSGEVSLETFPSELS